MKSHSLLLSWFVLAGCGVPLVGADLRPAPRDDGPAVAITVSAAAASHDLVRHADGTADEDSTLVLRLHLFNGGTVARSEDPGRYRLSVVGADGRKMTGRAVAWGPGDLPGAFVPRPTAGGSPPVSLAPGQAVTISVAFQGLAGLPLSSAARIKLEIPGETGARTLVLSAPAALGPRWTPWRGPRVGLLRAGVTFEGADHLTGVGLQLVLERGPWLFGFSVLDHGDLISDKRPGSFDAGGLGLVGGILPSRWVGVVAGADGLWGFGRAADGGGHQDLYLLQTWAAVRLQAGHTVGVGGGPLPLAHAAPSRLRSLVLDVGYAYTFVHGPRPSGGGLLIMAGAPLASF